MIFAAKMKWQVVRLSKGLIEGILEIFFNYNYLLYL